MIVYNSSQLLKQRENKKVIINGWIKKIRKLGSLLFFDLQDGYGIIQIIIKDFNLINNFTNNEEIVTGCLIKVKGKIQKKLTKTEQEEKEKSIEIELENYEVINTSKRLPFEIENKKNINEDTRFRYRYLDLRRPVSHNLLLVKHFFIREIRKFLNRKSFVEVETPILAQSSPEGAKSFLVPAYQGKYYTLPQSPQIFKQLLMMSSFDKYYQIAKSFRNEGSRSNRQIEFSQLDSEFSFTTSAKIRKFVERLLKLVLKKVFNLEIKIPFLVLSYQEAINKYGNDKPDLRKFINSKEKFNFVWIIKWPFLKYNSELKKYESFRHPFTLPEKKYIKPLLDSEVNPEKIICDAFDLVCNGEEILSGSMRIYQSKLQEKVLELLGYNQKDRKESFGYFLQALDFACPPHGGFALGIDRILAIILGVKNLKELIAFPKNIDGSCSLTGTPNFINQK